MRRRSVILAGFAALLLAPEHSSAQQALAKIPRVGILSPADSDKTPIFDAFREGLRDLGYLEGRNIILEFRLAHGDYSLFPRLAADLVNLPVDVIVTDGGLVLVRAVMEATKQLPIVITGAGGDPAALSLVASLARPGGNVTGLYPMQSDLNAKRLEVLRTAFPQISAVAVLLNPSTGNGEANFRATEEAAQSIGLTNVARVEAGTAETLLALRPTEFANVSGVVVLPDATFWNHRRDIVMLVSATRLPAIYPEREYVEDGGLMAYGANIPDNFRRAASYVDRILKGASPADLPIQQPVKFDFAVNLKTAHQLGVTIPQSILARADEVIE
jgi:putative ABC transport system substrate-binding protein